MAKLAKPGNDSRRPYGRHLAFTYGLLVIALAIGVLVVETCRSGTVARYGPNLVTELGGILATLIVVERLLTWQRERAATPVRIVALRRLGARLSGLSQLLLFSYKAAAPAGSPQPLTLDSLLTNWQREARFLDFSRPYLGVRPPTSWYAEASQVLTRFEDGVRDIIDRYLMVVGPELAAAAEDVVDNAVFQIVKQGAAIERVERSHGFELPRFLFRVQSADDPAADSLQEFADLVRRLYGAYIELGGSEIVLREHWYTEGHVQWGSARWEPSPPADPASQA